MSDVYLVKLLPHGTLPFAIKILKPHFAHHTDFGRRFRFEAALLTQLDHPHIVRVHECFEESGLVCMVLAFVDGQSLSERIRRDGAIKPAVALPMFKSVLDALDYAHQQGVIHRDIKPSNILLDQYGNPMLCDFGIAKQVGQLSMTGIGIKLGTPQYMSPEQIKGIATQPVDHRSDIYSAGIVLYEMLAGAVPFDSASTRSEFEILEKHINAEPPDLQSMNEQVPAGLARLVHKALRKDPARRYQGGYEFRQAIERFENGTATRGDPIETDPSTAGARAGRQYAVYQHPALGLEAIKIGMCWPVLLFGFAWMLYRRLFLHAVVWLCIGMLLMLLAFVAMLPSNGHDGGVLAVALCVGAVVTWLVPLFRGNQWRQEELRKRGYVRIAEMAAPSAEAAIVEMTRQPAKKR